MVTTRQLGTASILAMAAIFLLVAFQLNTGSSNFISVGSGPMAGRAAQQALASGSNLQALDMVLSDSCTDPDSANRMTAGAVTATGVAYGGTITAEDYCIDQHTVNEALCDNGRITYQSLLCPPNSQCIKGACA